MAGVAEAQLKARAQPQDQPLGRRDRDDPAGELDARQRSDGADGRAEIAFDVSAGVRPTSFPTQIRARSGLAARSTRAITRPRSETTNAAAPWRTTATGRSRTIVTRSVCGYARSKLTAATVGRAVTSVRAASRSRAKRLSPSCASSAFAPVARPSGPRRSPRSPEPRRATSRARARARVARRPARRMPRAATGPRGRAGRGRGDRREPYAGTGRRRSPHAYEAARCVLLVPVGPPGEIRRAGTFSWRLDAGQGTCRGGMRQAAWSYPCSPIPEGIDEQRDGRDAPRADPQPSVPTTRIKPLGSIARGRRAHEHHLLLELHAELLPCPPPRLAHQSEAIDARRAVRVLDEVRVPRRDHGAADPMPLEAAQLEHAPRAELSRGFLNTDPNVRLFVGCVAFRRATSSVTSDLISSTGRGARRYSTRATTSSGRSAECR